MTRIIQGVQLFSRIHDDRHVILMARDVLDGIQRTIGSLPAETGGILGGSRANGLVHDYYFDETASRTAASYTPDHDAINAVLREEWNPRGSAYLGSIHSHPRGYRTMSGGDDVYARRILELMPIERLMVLIAMSGHGGQPFEILPYLVSRGPKGGLIREKARLGILDALPENATELDPDVLLGSARSFPVNHGPSVRVRPAWRASQATSRRGVDAHHNPSRDTTRAQAFQRVTGSYDVEGLGRCRVVVIGVGGAAEWIEHLARCGVGEFVLIDRDRYSASNIGTQQAYRSDIGEYKVQCIARRVEEINPEIRVRVVPMMLDELTDDTVRALATEPLASRGLPHVSMLAGMTDDFHAQARISRLSLHFGLPSIAGQVWPQSRGIEVTFTFPGVTPCCQRCVLSSRYAHFASGFRPQPGASQDSNIFATARLSALKGYVALALLHRGLLGTLPSAGLDEDHPRRRWGRLLDEVAHRNLAVVRLDPHISTTLKVPFWADALSGADASQFAFDETLWRPQTPEDGSAGRPVCPDCGGTGDLRDAIGTLSDTRLEL